MSHYAVTFFHGHVSNMEDMVGMAIECDAPSETDAAEILFTAANRGNEIPAGVQVIEPLHGCSMTVGDLAIVLDLDSGLPAAMWCGLTGWKPAF